jgi:hypothetical protein
MAFTLAEVNGYPIGSTPPENGKKNNTPSSTQSADYGGSGNSSDRNDPSAVPEPGTMLLMAVGVGAAALIRKSRKSTK